MNKEYTEGNWAAKGRHIVALDGAGKEIDVAYAVPWTVGETVACGNARRIVACLNACAGVSTEILEKGASHDWALLMDELEGKIDQLQFELQEAKGGLQ